MLKEIKKIDLDKVFLLNIILIVLYSILKDIRFFNPFKTFFIVILLVLLFIGFINILINFYKIKFNNYFFNLGIMFCFTILISSALMSKFLADSLKESLITSYCILGITCYLNNLDDKKLSDFRYISLKVIIFLILFFTMLSNLLFLTYGPINFDFFGTNITLGSYGNRMFGVFESLTVPISASNIVLSMIFKNAIKFNSKKEDMYIYYLSIISSLIYLALSFSYGIILSVAISISIYYFFLNFKNNFNIIFNVIISIAIIMLFIRIISLLRNILYKFLEIALYNTDNGINIIINILGLMLIFLITSIFVKYDSKIKKIFNLRENPLRNRDSKKNKVYKLIIFIFILLYAFLSLLFSKYNIAKIKNFKEKEDISTIEIFDKKELVENKKELEKILKVNKDQQDGILTGRDRIWKYGIEKLKFSPLFGYGLGAFEGETVIGSQKLQHFHSVFIQGLVSGGVIHFIFLILLITYILYRYLRFLFMNTLDKNYNLIVSIFSFIVLMGVNGLIETSFLYVNRYSQYITWYVIGISTLNLYKSKNKSI